MAVLNELESFLVIFIPFYEINIDFELKLKSQINGTYQITTNVSRRWVIYVFH